MANSMAASHAVNRRLKDPIFEANAACRLPRGDSRLNF